MNIFKLLTKNNIRILKLIDNTPLHIRDIADKLKISPASVHNLIKILKKNNLITEKQQKNRKIISLNKTNPIIIQIKRIINFNDIINTKSFKKLKKIGKIGIYGSFAQGTNDKDSDLDIWIKTNNKENIRPIIRELEKELKIRINPLIITKISTFKKNNPEFYLRLILTSIGEKID